MPDSTLALTFQDFIVRVAEYLGVAYYGPNGDQAAQVPVDAHDLDVCKRLVNDGYRRFINSNDKWQFLTPLISITFDPTGVGPQCVNADPSRYYMPDGFYGNLLYPWTYPPEGPRIRIETIHEGRIRELFAGAGSTTGNPRLVAFRPLQADANTNGKRYEAIFWPKPNAVYSVTARARLYPDRLEALTDKSVAGFEHDETIIAAAKAEAERQRNDAIGVEAQAFADALQRSITNDRTATPKRLGDYGDGSDDKYGRQGRRPLNYFAVDSYNGNPV